MAVQSREALDGQNVRLAMFLSPVVSARQKPLSRRVTMHDSPASAPVNVSHIQDGGVGSGGNGVGANMQGSSGNNDGSAQAVKRAMNVKSRTHHVHPLWP